MLKARPQAPWALHVSNPPPTPLVPSLFHITSLVYLYPHNPYYHKSISLEITPRVVVESLKPQPLTYRHNHGHYGYVYKL